MSETVETTRTETPADVAPASLTSRIGSFLDAQESAAVEKKPAEKVAAKTDPETKEILTPDAKADADDPILEIIKEADGGEGAESEEELDAEFKEAAEKHGIPLTLDDVPEEARRLVAKKLKDMERGFTKAQQEARSYRAEKAAFEVERDYVKKSPAMFIADLVTKDPSIVERVNEEVTKRDNPAYREALDLNRKTAMDRAAVDAHAAKEREAALTARGEHLETFTEAQSKVAGIPFALVEDAVALAISQNPEITDEEVAKIVQSKAVLYKKHIGANKGAKARELAREKASDAKNAGLKDVPATAARSAASREALDPNSVTGQAKPLTLRERLNATLDERAAA